MSTNAVGLLLSDDLIFTSRVAATAQAHGLTLRAVRTTDQLVALAAGQHPACVIVDLANPGLDIAALVGTLRASGDARAFVVAYGSHVDTETLRAARAAGCDVVLPRSRFVEELPSALPAWYGSAGRPETPLTAN